MTSNPSRRLRRARDATMRERMAPPEMLPVVLRDGDWEASDMPPRPAAGAPWPNRAARRSAVSRKKRRRS